MRTSSFFFNPPSVSFGLYDQLRSRGCGHFFPRQKLFSHVFNRRKILSQNICFYLDVKSSRHPASSTLCFFSIVFFPAQSSSNCSLQLISCHASKGGKFLINLKQRKEFLPHFMLPFFILVAVVIENCLFRQI